MALIPVEAIDDLIEQGVGSDDQPFDLIDPTTRVELVTGEPGVRVDDRFTAVIGKLAEEGEREWRASVCGSFTLR